MLRKHDRIKLCKQATLDIEMFVNLHLRFRGTTCDLAKRDALLPTPLPPAPTIPHHMGKYGTTISEPRRSHFKIGWGGRES